MLKILAVKNIFIIKILSQSADNKQQCHFYVNNIIG